MKTTYTRIGSIASRLRSPRLELQILLLSKRAATKGLRLKIVIAPHIFGSRTVAINRYTYPVNLMMASARTIGKGFVIGEGTTVWSHFHVQDQANSYLVLLKHVLDRQTVPSGEKGIHFAKSSVNSHVGIAQKVAQAVGK